MPSRDDQTGRPGRPKAPAPWHRAEAGRYRSADDRFTLESGGGGRWFVTDGEAVDELGLPRTSGPFPTLAAAKTAADDARARGADPSPLAERLAGARTRPGSSTASRPVAAGGSQARPVEPQRPVAAPPAPARTWLDDLADQDPAAAREARRQIAALEREGVSDAEGLVRRDVRGDVPAVAAHLAARDILAAVAALPDPTAAAVAAAVASVLASGRARDGLPGWELRERDGSGRRSRSIRITAEHLLAAAEDARDR